MDSLENYRITTVEQLRDLLGQPLERTLTKFFPTLDQLVIDFIGRSSVMMMATADTNGLPQVSPKGDQPGFVAIEDEHTLLIPDRKGNRLLFGLENILINPAVSLIFLIPGTDETLRVEGRATLTTDPAVLDRLAAPRHPALLAIRVAVDRCYFHCAKAFLRAQLWNPETWPPKVRISLGEIYAKQSGRDAAYAKEVDIDVAKNYKNDV